MNHVWLKQTWIESLCGILFVMKSKVEKETVCTSEKQTRETVRT